MILQGWKDALQNHPDRGYQKTIAGIISHGARIGYRGPDQRILSDNLASAKSDPETLTQDLAEQVRHGRIEKVEQPPTRFISSPLGLAPKSNGKWRRIHHLSFPAGKSVNDHIQAEWRSIEYTSFDDAVQSLLRVGTGAILVKRDLADAFRHIPVSQNDTWLLGFFWEGTYWVEKFSAVRAAHLTHAI